MSELKETVSITAGYRTANTQHSLISMHTGDGMALAFFSGPEAPVHCAVEIAKELKHHPRIKLRMGVNSGPVYRIPDIKGEPNVAGGGVNFAQRVMDCGDDGHILLSSSIADVLRQHGRWAPLIHELGVVEVKHGELINIYNLCTPEVGNPAIPQKMLAKPTTAGMGTPATGSRAGQTPYPPGASWQPSYSPSAAAAAATVGIPVERPGKRLGDYEIVRELGHGGMGQVYLVRNVISDRLEAMKVLLPDLAQKGELANRFMREIKLLASLEHPNIAQLRTAFTAENQLVMIMEYVEGENLAYRLERGAFSVPDAVDYIGQALAALNYAHAKGIIHRDIKPANMMLTPQGVVKLMDFGIARSTTDLGMTVTGATMGSLDYMSPEQVKSDPMDARSDLYSVGVSLYQMVTGKRMFAATSSYSVMEAHVKEIPRAPIELQPTLPKALSDIIMMSLAKDPAQRFQSAEAFRSALSQVSMMPDAAAAVAQPQPLPVGFTPPPSARTASVTPSPATPAPSSAHATPLTQPVRGGRHFGWLLAAAIVVLVAVFGGTQVYRHSQTPAIVSATPNGASHPAPSTAAPEPVQPLAAPAAPSSPAPVPHSPKARSHDQGGNSPALGGPPPGPTPEEIAAQKKLFDDLENETDHLDSRAAAAESGVGALEQQMQQSGLGLRGDMVAARSNMRTDLAKAKQALDGGDTDRARKYLDMAGHEVDKLEAFLGRR